MIFNIQLNNEKSVSIKASRRNIKWNNDEVSLYDIGRSESDLDEYVIDWIPEYLIEAASNKHPLAQFAISDYIAGWYGY